MRTIRRTVTAVATSFALVVGGTALAVPAQAQPRPLTIADDADTILGQDVPAFARNTGTELGPHRLSLALDRDGDAYPAVRFGSRAPAGRVDDGRLSARYGSRSTAVGDSRSTA